MQQDTELQKDWWWLRWNMRGQRVIFRPLCLDDLRPEVLPFVGQMADITAYAGTQDDDQKFPGEATFQIEVPEVGRLSLWIPACELELV